MLPERSRLVCHVVRLVDEKLDTLTTIQDLLYVLLQCTIRIGWMNSRGEAHLDHDVLDLVELLLGTVDLVLRRRRVVLIHQTFDLGTKCTLDAIRGHIYDVERR